MALLKEMFVRGGKYYDRGISVLSSLLIFYLSYQFAKYLTGDVKVACICMFLMHISIKRT
jgi:hypothetical protein